MTAQRFLIATVALFVAAATLPTVDSSEAPAADVYFLSGRKFWYQSCFCAWTLADGYG